MRAAVLALILAAAVAPAAHAGPAEDAGSAMGACLAAVIERAPVADIRIGEVAIHREQTPNACTVNVSGGDPAAARAAVMAAIAARSERFTPARTPWSPGEYATREAFCDLPTRKPYGVMVSTAHPGAEGLVLTATAIEMRERDERCDADLGPQSALFH